MNYKSIIKILAIISSIVLLFFSSELLIGYIYDEDVVKLLKYILYLLGLNISILLFLKSHKINLKIKESILTVNLLWILLGVLGGFPLYLYTDISFASAFFEAISGFTTTGATVYSDIESLPHHILFHRSLMHWLGGMGVIVLSVGLLSMIIQLEDFHFLKLNQQE